MTKEFEVQLKEAGEISRAIHNLLVAAHSDSLVVLNAVEIQAALCADLQAAHKPPIPTVDECNTLIMGEAASPDLIFLARNYPTLNTVLERYWQ